MPDLPFIALLRRRIRTLPPQWVDVALTALVMVVQLWPFVGRDNPHDVPWHWWGYVVVVVAVTPLAWRRRMPVPVLIFTLLATSLYDLAENLPSQPIWYGGLVAMYTVAMRSSRWARLSMIVLATCGGMLLVGSSDTALRGIVLFVAAYAIGRAAAVSRAYAAALEERAARLEHERQVEAERAAERERARIAHDMHDILAHAVSLMVVQAEAGPVVVRSDPARAEAAFDAIAAAGRDAMLQLRRMLGVLKEGEGPRAPQPTIGDLPTLAGQVTGTGLDVAYSTSGEPRPLPPDVEVAAYRITQEALTNIVKHAGASRADIRLRWDDDALTIDVTDDGPGSGRSLPSGGNGLIGIQERATACGGTATAGRRADGPGFQVSVRLPLPATAA
ncbi:MULTISPECIES: sensor histidine kinase [Streptosporangium]|uniref:histidine kinase n=1 Tax=Streptosporangium brasiliense TaxID=47480 RepID=A0ABT9R3I6_9ACTN|nr:histidine kinase [Streptosporangium brasiliense]MDP9863789.1 signal transduction histidine kinase [Streptosporangium brasiliense]